MAESCSLWGAFAALEGPLTLLGALLAGSLLLKLALRAACGLRNHIVSGWWRADLSRYGRWAVVTGATDGIGKAYARELARRGLDVVLISRTLEKLKKVAAEIEGDFRRETRILRRDFTAQSDVSRETEAELQGLEIGILVNNVGMKISEDPTRFLNIPDLDQMLDKTISCNIRSVLGMTRIILPGMVRRKKGLIINLASEAGNRPYPMSTVYSATKAFVDFFSRGLHAEYKAKGITVQSVMPLLVSTDMTYRMKTNALVKSPDAFACEALNTVGYANRTSGCLSHSLQSFAVECLPDCVFHYILTLESFAKTYTSLKENYEKNKKSK